MEIVYSPRSLNDINAIVDYIAQDDYPTAEGWLNDLLFEIRKLKEFPKMGRQVPELGRADLLEIIVGNYRVVYSIKNYVIEIKTVRHLKRLFKRL